MNTESSKSEYLLLFRGTHWDKGLSPEEIQRVVGEWYAWFERGLKDGSIKGGQPLRDEGKLVSGKGGRSVADGPFAESKEAIGGYFLLSVNSEEEALAIARQCPALDYGLQVEVRPVADQCMVKSRAEEEMAAAVA